MFLRRKFLNEQIPHPFPPAVYNSLLRVDRRNDFFRDRAFVDGIRMEIFVFRQNEIAYGLVPEKAVHIKSARKEYGNAQKRRAKSQ